MNYIFTMNENQLDALIEALHYASEATLGTFTNNEQEALQELLVSLSYQANKQER